MTGNMGLFFDLGGTLVKLDETRELPLDAAARSIIELLPGVAEKLAPMRDHLIFVVTNQAGIKRGRFTDGSGRGRDRRTRSAARRDPDRVADLSA